MPRAPTRLLPAQRVMVGTDSTAPRLARGPSTRFAASHGTWLAVVGAAVLALALRIPFINEPAYPDEGGYLLVAGQWHGSGTALYGNLFADRPPLLMLFWWAASAWGGVETARMLACLLVVVLVAGAGWAGHQVGGHSGAVWSSLVAAALASTPALGAQEVDGELLAAPLVMVCCALMLAAVRQTAPRAQRLVAAAAGLAGAFAVLVKQNFFDGLVFAAVLIVTSAMSGALSRRSALRLLGCGAAGVAATAAVTVWWASTTAPGVDGLWYVMYGFRSDAGRVILSQSLAAPIARLWDLSSASLVSGLVVIAVLFVTRSWSQLRRREPVSVAIMAMLAVGIAGVALGASYWTHYLVGLVPAVALAAGSLGRRRSNRRRIGLQHVVSPVVAVVVASAVVTSVVSGTTTYPTRVTEVGLERLLSAASRPSDSALITYGHANVLEAAGVRPGYPYLWSLPMRVLDPRLDLMTHDLAGTEAPTWVLEWEGFDSWGIDADGRLAATISAHYHQVTTVCGVGVLLHDGLIRELPAVADPCAG